jgi:hypothetical protein
MHVPRSRKDVEDAAVEFGPTPAAKALLLAQAAAAREAIARSIYVTWRPDDDERKECSRIGSDSGCLCGHAMNRHAAITPHTLRPPACLSCKRCPGFRFAPSRPEEVGQWWMPRRKDFNLASWQSRLRAAPNDYACIGCDRRVSEHSIHIETAAVRIALGLPTGAAFIPFDDSPVLQGLVLGESGGGRTGAGTAAPRATTTPEEQYELGIISAAEYRTLVSHQHKGILQSESAASASCGIAGMADRSATHVAVASASPSLRTSDHVVPPALGAARRGHRDRDARSVDPVLLTNIGMRPAGSPGKSWMRERKPAIAASDHAEM